MRNYAFQIYFSSLMNTNYLVSVEQIYRQQDQLLLYKRPNVRCQQRYTRFQSAYDCFQHAVPYHGRTESSIFLPHLHLKLLLLSFLDCLPTSSILSTRNCGEFILILHISLPFFSATSFFPDKPLTGTHAPSFACTGQVNNPPG